MIHLSKWMRMVGRFLLVWAVDAVSLIITAALLPGMAFVADAGRPAWLVALVAALTLGLVNFSIRPLLMLAARPFGLIATLIVGFLVNALALLLTAALLHPPDMPAPETRNSEDFFYLLNARRRASAMEE